MTAPKPVPPVPPAPLLNKQQAADLIVSFGIPCSVATLDKWRTAGKGPASIKHGKHVRFDPAVIHAWAYHTEAESKW